MLGFTTRVYNAYKNSWRGIKYAYRSEWTFRSELIILMISIPLAFIIGDNLIERMLMISSIILLPMMELVNTAIETTINRISLEHHELSGLAKDMASAAMLFVMINAIIIWGMISFSRIITCCR